MEGVIATQMYKGLGERLYSSIEQVIIGFKIDYEVNLKKITSHFEEYLMSMFDKYSYINTLVCKNSRRKLLDLYQPLTLSIDDIESPKNVKVVGFPKDLFDKYPKFLITDTAGMGKSTLSRRMYLDVIYNNYGIPIFIELRRLSENNDIYKEIQNQVTGLNKEFDLVLLKKLLKKGDFIVFLDGYDEIPLKHKEFVSDNIQKLIDGAPLNKYILTSRPEDALAIFGSFQKSSIKPLTRNEAYELLRRYDENGEVSKHLIDTLDKDSYKAVSEFLKNPFLTSLLYTAFEYKQTIPLKKHIFYAQVIDAYFQSHDLTKGGGYIHEKKSGLDVDDFNTIMRRIGYECMRLQQVEFNRDELLTLIDKTKASYPTIQFNASDLLTDLEHSVPLFCVDGLLHKWVHKSIQEYYAAMYICRDLNERKSEVLNAIYNSSKLNSYINVLDLLCDIDSNSFLLHFLKPELEEYITFHTNHFCKLPGIPNELINERIYLLYKTKIGILFIDEQILKDKELIQKASSVFYSCYGVRVNRIGIKKNKILRLSVISIQKDLHELLRVKYPSLFKKYISTDQKIDIPIGDFIPVNNITLFSNSAKQYEKLNSACKLSTDNNYIDIDKAKEMLRWINSNISVIDTSDILSGL